MLFCFTSVFLHCDNHLRTGAELNNAGQRSGEIYPFGRTKFGSRCAAKMRSMATTLAVWWKGKTAFSLSDEQQSSSNGPFTTSLSKSIISESSSSWRMPHDVLSTSTASDRSMQFVYLKSLQQSRDELTYSIRHCTTHRLSFLSSRSQNSQLTHTHRDHATTLTWQSTEILTKIQPRELKTACGHKVLPLQHVCNGLASPADAACHV